MPFSRTFQGLEFWTIKFQDFPGSVQTLCQVQKFGNGSCQSQPGHRFTSIILKICQNPCRVRGQKAMLYSSLPERNTFEQFTGTPEVIPPIFVIPHCSSSLIFWVCPNQFRFGGYSRKKPFRACQSNDRRLADLVKPIIMQWNTIICLGRNVPWLAVKWRGHIMLRQWLNDSARLLPENK